MINKMNCNNADVAGNTGDVDNSADVVRNTNIVCVTNRKLVKAYEENGSFLPFLEKIKEAAKKKPAFIILREKDLSPDDYKELAKKVFEICDGEKLSCVLHYFYREAIELGAKKIHLPLHILENMTEDEKKCFDVIGASTHSVEDARRAKELGASYITAGHVFATDCKKGLAPRGLQFLADVCDSVDIDVYAIGGISENNMKQCIGRGAKGVCMMSGFMR
ncbi:thiamine phosphate synthase [Butyribacter sp.]|uniref:thiamine phosphate synthase n=1 Tax=Butyribacter sp. TaxID=2822465 RepID=UPI002A99BA3D|nr:thiamine phosphate synthase [Butyribacter sp.]